MRDDSTKSMTARAKSREIQEYWTPERRSKAKPEIAPTFREAEIVREFKISEEMETAKIGIISAKKPTQTPNVDKDWEAKKRGIDVVNPTDWPYRCCGILFFTRGGVDRYGSASAIGDKMILTAGHCLFRNGEWASNILFCPAYPVWVDENGDSISFSSIQSRVFNAWIDNADRAYDFGTIRVSDNMNIGYLGSMWNFSPWQSWKALGYPSNAPHSGEDMYEANGSFNIMSLWDFWEALSIFWSGQMRMDNNNMHAGSSGGPWIGTYEGRQEYVNGVNSHHHGGDDDQTEHSPYFDSKFKTMYDDTLNSM